MSAYAERRDALDQRWSAFVRSCGFVGVPLPNDPEAAAELIARDDVAGAILTGGNDLVAYGGDAPERDATERRLLDEALRLQKPVLGVCRGMQVIQDRFGVPLERTNGHVATRHEIDERGTSSVRNSYHGFGTTQTTEELEVLARAADGIVESVHHRTKPLLGIMWHPERCEPFDERDCALVRSHFADS